MAKILIGYDVEIMDKRFDWHDQNISRNSISTAHFLKRARRLHEKLSVPCTLFVVGKTLEENLDLFKSIKDSPMIDLQQHTYSHLRLKTVVMDDDKTIQVFRGGSLEQIREEVNKTNKIFKKKLGITPHGLTGPYCYYRGLQDRPDILEILEDAGIKFLRTDGRNEKDFQPVAFEHQPYFYTPQGFPEIMEFPLQGWQDVYLREKHGWDNLDGFIEEIKTNIDYIRDRNLIWDFATHDWSSIVNDPEMRIMREIIIYGQQAGIEFKFYKEHYKEQLAAKEK